MVQWVFLKSHHLIRARSASQKPSPKLQNVVQLQLSAAVTQSPPSHAPASPTKLPISPPAAAPHSSFSLATNYPASLRSLINNPVKDYAQTSNRRKLENVQDAQPGS